MLDTIIYFRIIEKPRDSAADAKFLKTANLPWLYATADSSPVDLILSVFDANWIRFNMPTYRQSSEFTIRQELSDRVGQTLL